MTKQKFKQFLLELMDIKKNEDELNEVLKKFNPDFNHIYFSRHETLIVDLLKEAMDDKYEWISYFLYERDGKFTTKKIISDKNGKKIPFDNMDDLYDLITNNSELK